MVLASNDAHIQTAPNAQNTQLRVVTHLSCAESMSQTVLVQPRDSFSLQKDFGADPDHRVVRRGRADTGVGLLIAPQFSAKVLEFTP